MRAASDRGYTVSLLFFLVHVCVLCMCVCCACVCVCGGDPKERNYLYRLAI